MRRDQFQKTVWDYYRQSGRDLPWRRTNDPYRVLVSEIMLQQTQVDRVVPKYTQFLQRFPNPNELARAALADVLGLWQGLGYNRRARFLHQAAQAVVARHDGMVPSDRPTLKQLPGVGDYTASAVAVFAFNQPVVLLETNVRAVYLHHFYRKRRQVSDRELIPLLEQTLDTHHPRQWHWALMDYGAHLKRVYPNPSRASRHHSRQSKFEGSQRQLRGQVLRLLLDHKTLNYSQLARYLPDKRLPAVLSDLEREQLIMADSREYAIT